MENEIVENEIVEIISLIKIRGSSSDGLFLYNDEKRVIKKS